MVLRPSGRRAASCGRPEQRLTTGRRRPRMIPRISTNRREPPARVRSVGTGSGKRRVEVPSAERDTVGSSPEDHVDGSQLSPVRRGRRIGRGRHGRPRPPHRRNPPGSQRHRPPRTCRGAADARAIGAGCGHGSCVRHRARRDRPRGPHRDAALASLTISVAASYRFVTTAGDTSRKMAPTSPTCSMSSSRHGRARSGG
jgi:hypothetical protein